VNGGISGVTRAGRAARIQPVAATAMCGACGIGTGRVSIIGNEASRVSALGTGVVWWRSQRDLEE